MYPVMVSAERKGLAVRAEPADLSTRYRLASLLLDQGRADEALSHARWCARMQPESAAYRGLLEKIHQQRLRAK